MSVTTARLAQSGAFRATQAGTVARTSEAVVEEGFSPDDISGLIGWFDADDTTTMEFDASPRPKIFHSKVGSMVCGNDTASTRPTRESMPNDLQYLAFDGTTYLRGDTYPSTNCITTSTVTVCALVRKDANNAYGRMFSFHDPGAGADDYNNVGSFTVASYGPTNSFPSVDRNNAVGFVRDTATNVGVWCNMVVEFSGTNATLYNNGNTFGPASSTGTFSVDRFWIGARQGQIEMGIGSFAEVCIYDRVLTSTERANVYDYFNVKWLDVAPTVPGAPDLVSATAGDTTVALAWTAPASTGGSPITSYLVEKSPNGTSSWTTAVTPNPTASPATATGLSNGTIQYFRVSAVNAIGTGPVSDVMSATPAGATVPGAPTLNTATPGDTAVTLAWTAGSTGGSAITSYLVEKSPNGTSSWTTAVTPNPTASPATATGLSNDTIQYFRVSAVNAIGTGTASNTMSATPTAASALGYRTFNGSTDKVVLAVGESTAENMDSYTIMAVVRLTETGGGAGPAHTYIEAMNGSDTLICYWYASWFDDQEIDGNGSYTNVGGGLKFNVNEWAIVGATKTAGSGVTVRFHKYVFSTTTWGHGNGGSMNASGAGTMGSSGKWDMGWRSDEAWQGDIAVIGFWATPLANDAAVDALSVSLAAWTAASPTHLWRADQTPVVDLIGTADQTSISGTSVTGSGCPLPLT